MMNRGGNGTSAGSACGGMYRKVAQDMCEENVMCLGYVQIGTVECRGTVAPKKDKARRGVPVKKRSREKKKIRCIKGENLKEDQPKKRQTRPGE